VPELQLFRLFPSHSCHLDAPALVEPQIWHHYFIASQSSALWRLQPLLFLTNTHWSLVESPVHLKTRPVYYYLRTTQTRQPPSDFAQHVFIG
jgi:hypothetical protein